MSDIENQDAGETEKYHRPVKTFVIRIGRMTDNEKKCYSELNSLYCIPFAENPLVYSQIFKNDNPVTMEIGFGMGHATVEIAEKNPDMNYIGSEVHKPGVGRLLGEIQKRQLKNLCIIEHDAIETLEKMIPDSSLDAFHIFFPDPWPKKKHHKRRLIHRPRTELLASKLKKGGYLYFVTDWAEYAENALEELNATSGIHNRYEGFAPHQEWRPRTKFEQKGIDAGRDIFELMFEKD
ncbi:MAG: tRNA (guanosine(46)-N7)-methyltransferase TrmB [Treponema sp.]|nr:tRNA (guanosine(46)-N7)-methyltransferase TrmB [Treponema sp.]